MIKQDRWQNNDWLLGIVKPMGR